ncbi:hypothetical protein [Streptomyces sp. NPDC086777]|uniref:hypothetical protein n=1 Tax=Streptomyces sp. NPDC086777 TaxID=3154866 RepID=UPI00344FCF58
MELRWWHLAVVNAGRRPRPYAEGAPVADSPNRLSEGLTSLGLPWLVGGHEYAGAVDIVFHDGIGDIRVVNRPPAADGFLTAR